MNYYLEGWKKIATTNGRAGRKEYWTFALVNCLIYACLIAAATATQDGNLGLAAFIFGALLQFALIPVAIRRLHDTNRSGGWWFLNCFIVIGNIWFVILMLLDSQPGGNKYGPNPKGAAKPQAIQNNV